MLTYQQQLLLLPLVTAEIANAQSLHNGLDDVDDKVSKNLTGDYIVQLTSIKHDILSQGQ